MNYEEPVLSLVSAATELVLGDEGGADDFVPFPPTLTLGVVGLDD